MDNIKETFEIGLQKKKVSVRKMLIDLDISEPTYYRAIKQNSMSMKNYRRICQYLELDSSQIQNTKESDKYNTNLSDYWKGFIDQLSKEIADLKMENWNLKKELGKFESTLLALSV